MKPPSQELDLRAACVLSVIEPVSDVTWDKLSASLTQALLAEDRHSVSQLDRFARACDSCRDSRARPRLPRLERDSSTRSTAAEALTEALARRPEPRTTCSVGRRIAARCVTHSAWVS